LWDERSAASFPIGGETHSNRSSETAASVIQVTIIADIAVRRSRLSEQIFRVDRWSACRGWAAMRMGSGVK
jgi:hypothetical protein